MLVVNVQHGKTKNAHKSGLLVHHKTLCQQTKTMINPPIVNYDGYHSMVTNNKPHQIHNIILKTKTKTKPKYI